MRNHLYNRSFSTSYPPCASPILDPLHNIIPHRKDSELFFFVCVRKGAASLFRVICILPMPFHVKFELSSWHMMAVMYKDGTVPSIIKYFFEPAV